MAKIISVLSKSTQDDSMDMGVLPSEQQMSLMIVSNHQAH
jgi:hypothetical protein